MIPVYGEVSPSGDEGGSPGKRVQQKPTPNLLHQAFAHFQAGRLEPAAELLREYLKISTTDGQAYHLLGGIYYRQGRVEAARDHIARACALPGATAEMFNNLGAALKALGDAAGAIAAFQHALALEPGHPEALNNLGVMYRDQGDPRRAIELLRRVVALKPELAEAQKISATHITTWSAPGISQWSMTGRATMLSRRRSNGQFPAGTFST